VGDREAKYPLEPSSDEFRAMAAAVTEELVRFVEDLPRSRAADVEDVETPSARLREPAPEGPSPFEPLLATVMAGAAKAFNTTGPGYLAYIPGGGLVSAAVADFLACGINRYTGLWNPAPVLVELEWTAVRWLCDLFGYPATARGILTSGGSVSNLAAVVTARHALLPGDFLAGTLYASDQVHASVTKAAHIAGFPAGNVRSTATDPGYRIDLNALRSRVAEDRAAGFQPFLVAANAGSTNTGAVDPLDELADLAAEEGLWLHVDGAYGGFFQLTDRGRRAFRGIHRADSITLDPHKGMFLPYGTGALLVRDGVPLRDAHHVGAEYLQDLVSVPSSHQPAGLGDVPRDAPDRAVPPNFSEYSPELSRDFRGLRVWLPIKLHGLSAFRDALDEKLDLAALLYEQLAAVPDLEVVPPDLTVIAFRYAPPRRDGEDGNEFDAVNRRLLDRINGSGRIWLSSTMLRGRFTIRACILCHRTHRDRVEEAGEIIRRAVRDVAAGR
jgi:aromatic-L-amino-acid decarboxylase